MGREGPASVRRNHAMRRLLIVSPHFPPTNAPDMQRARMALPDLASLGWEPTVLCVDARDVAAPLDERLAASVPKDVRIERCRAWPLALTSLIGMRTLSRRAKGSLDRAGRRLIEETRPDLVFFTTTQFPIVSLGAAWKRSHGVPYVVDLQDPWVTDYYSRPGAPRPPGGWKYRLASRSARRQEPEAFEPAAGFVSVSPVYLSDLGARYPWFSSKPQATIPFGADEHEFQLAAATAAPAFRREPGHIHLVSVGAAGPIMADGLRALFTQLRGLRDTAPELAKRVRIHFIGTSYAHAGAAQSVRPLADGIGVGDQVEEQTSRVPWHVAQATMSAADGIIVLGSSEPSYTPSKIAGCFLAALPCLVVATDGSGAARLNGELGLGERLDPSGSTPKALGDFLLDLGSTSPLWKTRRREAHFRDAFTSSARNRELAAFLDKALAGSAAP